MDLWEPTKAELSFFHATWGFESSRGFNGPFIDHVLADGVSISGDGRLWYPIWEGPEQQSGVWQEYTIDLAAAATAAGLTLGEGFQIKFQQSSYDELPFEGRGYDEIVISMADLPRTIEDWYRFTLQDGQSATAALAVLGRGELALELYDGEHHLLAAGIAADNLERVINNFVDGTDNGTPETYFLHVSGTSWAAYSLVVTREADFDTEPNGSQIRGPQEIFPAEGVLGYVGLAAGESLAEQAKLTASDADDEDQFGYSVSISGDTAIVGVPRDEGVEDDCGSAYVFQLEGNRWTEQQKLTIVDADPYDQFGSSVSISGDTVVIGAYGDDEEGANAGAAYVFRYDGSLWTQQQKLTASDPGDFAFFGSAVSICGDTMIVGAPEDEVAGEPGAGAAYVFQFDGTQWIEQQKLALPDAESYDRFGCAVSIWEEAAIVGASGDDGIRSDSGAAYVFQFDGSQWQQKKKLTGGNSRFGQSVSISGEAAIVGEGNFHPGTGETPLPSMAYVFRFDGSQWLTEQILMPSSWYGIDGYGQSVSISGDCATVGAPYDDTYGLNSGATYFYRFAGGRWIEHRKATASNAATDEYFGYCVSIADDVAIVGAWGDDGPQPNSGSAYVFRFSPEDEYAVSVRAGDPLVISTATPGDGPQEFVNDLDPLLQLYDPAGTLVAEDDNGAPDGRNAMLFHTAATTGVYSVRVVPVGGSEGEYFLTIGGHTGAPPAFEVVATDPVDGGGPSGVLKVQFNDLILAGTLDAADLIVDGLPAAAVTLLDGNTARFNLPAGLQPDKPLRTATIAAGKILDLQGTPVEPFTTTLTVDTVGPRLLSSSILEGRMMLPYTDWTYSASFSKQLNRANIDQADVSLEGVASGLHAPYGVNYNGDKSVLMLDFAGLPIDDYTLTLRSGDGALEDLVGNDLDGEADPTSTVPSGDGNPGGDFVVHFSVRDISVVGRHLFYNDSAFDDPDAGAGDDDAIAVDKKALLPGQTATFANYTSYDHGINGIMVDVFGLPDGVTPDTGDFQFKTGNENDADPWTTVAATPTIAVRRNEGVGGSDRITIIWSDNAIQNQWLQVTVAAGDNTGLAEPDVFYFGNAIGESGNSTTDAKVNAFDILGARNNQRTFIDPAPIDFDFDYDRDARVNATDMLIARNNQTHFLNALRLITVPPSQASGAEESTLLKSLPGELSLPAIRLDLAEGRGQALAEKVTAHDTVLEGNMGNESGNLRTSPGKLDWLYEFELMGTNRLPTNKGKMAEDALDKVLVGDWQ